MAGCLCVKSCHVLSWRFRVMVCRAVSRPTVPCQHLSRLIRVNVDPSRSVSIVNIYFAHSVYVRVLKKRQCSGQANESRDLASWDHYHHGFAGALDIPQQHFTSVLSQQQTSATAFITQHQHSVSTINTSWRLR